MDELVSANGTALSRLCFGAMQFGGKADATASAEMYAACRAAGVTIFDTAHTYTGGASEKILGELVRPERDSVFLVTKAAYTGGAGQLNLEKQIDESRARLGTDYIDLLYLHRWDPETDLKETFACLAKLQSEGTIRAIGVSNYAAWQVMKAQAVAQGLGTRIDTIQPMYSLVKRQAEVELLPMAQDQQIAVFPYSPLAAGLLTGKYAKGGTGRLTEDSRYAKRYSVPWMHSAATQLAEIAREEGIDAATLAVAWVNKNPAVTAPIISARSASQLEPALAAERYELSDALLEKITALSQTPAPATDRLEEA
jgi:aryl-alcohol dehydrogenase-like predicted oxidoreductase